MLMNTAKCFPVVGRLPSVFESHDFLCQLTLSAVSSKVSDIPCEQQMAVKTKLSGLPKMIGRHARLMMSSLCQGQGPISKPLLSPSTIHIVFPLVRAK